jgi:hypothetical protein
MLVEREFTVSTNQKFFKLTGVFFLFLLFTLFYTALVSILVKVKETCSSKYFFNKNIKFMGLYLYLVALPKNEKIRELFLYLTAPVGGLILSDPGVGAL